MPVNRCICHKITFTQLKRLAEEEGLKTVYEIRDRGLASSKCKLCEPYVEKLLETGETSFKPVFYSKTTEPDE